MKKGLKPVNILDQSEEIQDNYYSEEESKELYE